MRAWKRNCRILALIIVAHIISLKTKTAMQLESTPRFTEQLQHLGNLKSHSQTSVRTMHDKYRRIASSSTTKTITSSKRGRPLMLGSLNEKVKRFLLTLRSKGGAVNIVVAVAVAKALIAKCYDESLKVLDLDNLSWEKSPFVRGCFVKITCTTVQPEISEGVCKEAGLIFHHQNCQPGWKILCRSFSRN